VDNVKAPTGITLPSAIHSVFVLLFQTLSGSLEVSDLTYGAEVLGRGVLNEAGSLVGMFGNNLPVRITLDSSDSAENVMKSVQSTLLEALAYDFVSEMQIRRWSGCSTEMFDTLVNVQKHSGGKESGMERHSAQLRRLDDGVGDDVHYSFCPSIFVDEEGLGMRQVSRTSSEIDQNLSDTRFVPDGTCAWWDS
jgi:hypothetical protein